MIPAALLFEHHGVQRSGLLNHDTSHRAWRSLDEIQHEIVRVPRLHGMMSKTTFREVAKVHRDDHRRASVNCSC